MSNSSKACKTDWPRVTRSTYASSLRTKAPIDTGNPLPNVTWLSDLLKDIDSRRQKGYTAQDLPPPFTVPKSFAHVPHELLAADGYPKTGNWLHPACQYSFPAQDNKLGGQCLTRRARNQLSGDTTESSWLPQRHRRQGETRHPARATKGNEERLTDQSPGSAGTDGFNREFRRYDDPILPVEDYKRTMEIVSNMYHVYTHGHGQFVDRDSKKLICTFRFEDLETMPEATRLEHQHDVDTIMMATKLFRKLPLPPKNNNTSPEPTNKAGNKGSRLSAIESAVISSRIRETFGPVKPRNERAQSPPTEKSATSSPLTSLPPSDSEGEDLQKELEQSSANTTQPRLLKPLNDSDTSKEPPVEPAKVLTKARPTTNGALLKGKMFCIGNRAGYAADVLFAPYHPIQGVSKSLYRLFLSKLPNFGKSIGARFATFADHAFLAAHNQLVDLSIPPLSSESKDENPTPFDFAGNFAFTFNNFHNKPHTDNDKGKVYCVWYPFDSISGKIVTFSEGFVLEGGWFLFPAYRIAFNFGAKYAAQIAWSGKSTFHQTMASKEEDILNEQGKKVHYTRLGCSSQITMSLALAAAKRGTDKQWNSTSHCARDVLDCQDILNDSERDWKE